MLGQFYSHLVLTAATLLLCCTPVTFAVPVTRSSVSLTSETITLDPATDTSLTITNSNYEGTLTITDVKFYLVEPSELNRIQIEAPSCTNCELSFAHVHGEATKYAAISVIAEEWTNSSVRFDNVTALSGTTVIGNGKNSTWERTMFSVTNSAIGGSIMVFTEMLGCDSESRFLISNTIAATTL